MAQTPSADHQTIRVSADQTVLDVKTLLVNFTHLPAEDQRLVHAGQAWDNDSMVSFASARTLLHCALNV